MSGSPSPKACLSNSFRHCGANRSAREDKIKEKRRRRERNLFDHRLDKGSVEIGGGDEFTGFVQQFDVLFELLVRRRSLVLQRCDLKLIACDLEVETSSVPQSARHVYKTVSHQRDQQEETKRIGGSHRNTDHPRTVDPSINPSSDRRDSVDLKERKRGEKRGRTRSANTEKPLRMKKAIAPPTRMRTSRA